MSDLVGEYQSRAYEEERLKRRFREAEQERDKAHADLADMRAKVEKLTQERDEARELAREVGVAGMQLAGEMMEATDGWLVCLRDFGDLHLDCKRAEEGWDAAKAENERLRAWAAGQPCEHPIKTDHLGIDPDTGSAAGWAMKRCGECVPCRCKAARERGE